VGAFCGIAAPESFEKFLRDLGADLRFSRRFLDHYRFGPEDIASVFQEAVRARSGVYCHDGKGCGAHTWRTMICPIPLYHLRLEIDIIRGATDFDEAVERICFRESRQARSHRPFR
jgi:tetraacyldisaccharide 4'-kinase